MDRAIDRWLVAGAGVAIALMLANTTVTWRNTRELRESARWVTRTHEAITALESLLSLLKDAETGQRGFLITGEPWYLEPYNDALAVLQARLAEVERLADDRPEKADLAAMRPRIEQRLAELERNIELRTREGFAAAQASVATGRGKRLMDELREVCGAMVKEQQRQLRSAALATDATYRESLWTGLASGLLALVAVAAAIALLLRQVRVRHAVAQAAAEQGERLRTTLTSIGDAVITTDVDARVTHLNPVAQALTGWSNDDAVGQPLERVFKIVNESTRAVVANPALRALSEGVVVGLANHTVLLARHGTECPIDDSAAPIRCREGTIVGSVLVFRDVGERRSQELRLARSEALYRAIVEDGTALICRYRQDGLLTFVNEPYCRYFGMTADALIGSAFMPPAPEEDRRELAGALERHGPRMSPHTVEHRVLCNGGELRWIRWTCRAIADAEGAFMEYQALGLDITDRKLADAASAAATAKFQAFFDQAPLFAAILAVDGTLLDVNQLATSMGGYSRDQVIGRPFWVTPWWAGSAVVQAKIRAAVDLVAAGEFYAEELPYSWADGSEREVLFSMGPVRDENGRVTYLIPTGTDVTALREGERARLHLATIVETSDDAIISKSLDGIIRTWNAAAQRLFGYTADEAVGRHVSLLIPANRADEESRIIAKLRKGELVEHFDTVRLRKDGRSVHVSITVSPMIDGQGRFIGASKIARDITRQREAEERVAQLMAELKAADRRKDEFLATLAHELRNPLAPISSMLEVLKREDAAPEHLAQARTTMDRQLSQMVRLVDDLLDVSRITRNRLELRCQRVELASILHQSVETSRPLVDAAGHVLSVKLPPEPIYLDADAVRLSQVFGNLLTNACKYTEPGGRIDLTVERQDGDVVVSVRDTGIGIPAHKLGAVFEMFAQLSTKLDRSRGGLGIGLTLVKRLVELHHGEVTVSSGGLGRGSEFRVRLPVSTAPPDEPLPSPMAAAPAAGAAPPVPRRVLVVDDNKDAAVALATLLRITGNEIAMAHDGLAAIAAAEQFQPDLVLLDIGLPKLSGYEVARRIREQPWGRSMVLVAATGWGQEEDRRKSREAGFDHHLVKPISHDRLGQILADLP